LNHFARLGITDQMLAAGGARLTETRFYGRRGNHVAVPSTWFGGASALGLSRAEMDRRLLQRAREAGVTVLEETRAGELIVDDKYVRGIYLKTREGARAFRALVTIDATGRSRAIARRIEADAKSIGRKTKRRRSLVAFKAHLEKVRGGDGVCEIYFYRGGYGGLSSIEDGKSNFCFVVAAQDVRACGNDAARVMREIVMTNARAAQTLAAAHLRSEWLAVALDAFGRRNIVPAKGLLAIGDAASFIDPFTGSGMLMALESGQLVAESIIRALPQLRAGAPFKVLEDDYKRLYDKQFGARLRVCSLLRRAAFAPGAAEFTISALSRSMRVRRALACATRKTTISY
jgi:flavin-dependent dehydrogenase